MSAEQPIEWRWENGDQRCLELQDAQEFFPIGDGPVVYQSVVEDEAIR